MIVKPETLIGWHSKGFKLFWRWRSRLGRPRTPEVLRQLIVRMVRENPDLGRGAHRSRTVGEVRDLGFAAHGAGVLAAR